MSATPPTRRRRETPEELSAALRAEREGKAITLAQIARITRVPEPSLRRLEAAEFDKLPADVFVRGFLRSYARCVGLDPDDVVERYVESRSARRERARTAAPVEPAAGPTPGETSPKSKLRETGSFLARQFFDARDGDRGESSRRGAVTLAVIILVIVATLTMSYLLRRPSSPGDGVTAIERTTQTV